MILKTVPKKISFLLLLLIILSQTGCWNRRELDTLGITTVLALDRTEENKILLTAEIIKPQKSSGNDGGGSSTKELVKYVQSEGSSVFDALRNMTTKFDRKIFLAHNKLLIISEKQALDPSFNMSDFFQRDHEMRENLNILISKGNAAEVLGVTGGIEGIPGVYLERIIKNQRSNAKTVSVRGFEYYRDSLGTGIQPLLGTIEVMKKNKAITTKAGAEDYEISLEGSAVYKGALKGFLDGIETRNYNFIRGKVKSGIIAVPINSLIDASSIEILSATSDNDVDLNNEDIKFKSHIKIKGMLVEETAKINIREPATINYIEKITSDMLKIEIEDTIKKVQKEYKADIFGFGQLVHRKYPNAWKSLKNDWEEQFSKADIDVIVDVYIPQTGLISNNSRTTKEEK